LRAVILAGVAICVNGGDGVVTSGVAIDYPLTGSVFPPDITAPVFLWHGGGSQWTVQFDFADGAPPLHAQVASPSWQPDETLWRQIKHRSAGVWANLTIAGANSRASIRIETSRDPVGAPIFYREVPLMPSEVDKGVIKPLAPAAIPLITWKLRDLGQPESRVVLRGLHTCTNCHSFSKDGTTLGMDVDGPENDKGTYAIAPVSPRMTIANQDVITWNSFARKQGRPTIGFLSQISPDGRYAVTTLNEQVYVANFKDYRFLQVFYPTRGILAVYDRETRQIRALPGANDPNYVHTSAVWSPDGQYLVFQRARAAEAYPPGRKVAEYAGDPNELPVRYDLYRIPFRAGHGGVPEPVRGASDNGMSNTFPKVSPDGRWIVFVKCRNGMLMRPDSELWIVPVQGGEARRMRCNTSLMNSWHSFSPNGRWLVFSSKSRTPYTRMFLTHIDEDGNDTPPVLVENAAAPDRAVNLPEFVNLPPGGLLNIDVPAAEFYRLFDSALELDRQGQHAAAAAEWEKALQTRPRKREGPHQSRDRACRSGRCDPGDGALRTRHRAQPVLRRGAQQPWGRARTGEQTRRGGAAVPHGPGSERGLRRGAPQPCVGIDTSRKVRRRPAASASGARGQPRQDGFADRGGVGAGDLPASAGPDGGGALRRASARSGRGRRRRSTGHAGNRVCRGRPLR
jgi:WD40-like Beta Propeller Repeat